MAYRLFDSEFLKKLEDIALNIGMYMNNSAAGTRKSRAKGSSVEFSDYREYSIGDDFRKIDWNAYGRFDKFFIKLFMEEREACVNIFLDCSKSMDYGHINKSKTALQIAAVTAYLTLNNLDRVCINSMSENILTYSSPLIGRNMFHECIDYIEKLKFKGSIDINKCIKQKQFSSSGISIIISDFLFDNDIEKCIKFLKYKKQDIILINVLSKEELEPDMQGTKLIIDSETKRKKSISINSNILNKYKKQLNIFTSKLNEAAKRYGGQYLLISSEEPIEKIVFEHLSKSGIIYKKI